MFQKERYAERYALLSTRTNVDRWIW